MGKALLGSPATSAVVGYDRSTSLADAFFDASKAVNKASGLSAPKTLNQAITGATNFVVLVLVNESQCNQVCFGDSEEGNLASLLTPGACVILCSTVTATWARKTNERFKALGISFVDCPISGGPVRAAAGDLTLMASGEEDSLKMARPLLDAMGGEVHIVSGGAGMGSTVKMVHQLLAGVHICCAAEALALAAKAGLDVEQMYNIVNGAAGASWMFKDRGQRMIAEEGPDVKSALNLFIKDMGIVHAEAKELQSPIPVASAALQQFISGQSMGLGTKDDSSVVKVYETLSGVPVGKKKRTAEKKEGNEVGDLWTFANGEQEEILEVGDEPSHNLVVQNEYTRILRVSFPPFGASLAHRHAEDSLYFFLVEDGLEVVNHVKGSDPECDCMDFGECRYGTHKTEKPLVHKITNRSNKNLLCIDAEVIKQPPVVAAIPLMADKHELIKTREKCRIYKLTIPPGESATDITYPFFYALVTLRSSTIKTEIGGGSGATGISWEETPQLGDVQWKEPVTGVTQTNVGASVYEAYIAEWR